MTSRIRLIITATLLSHLLLLTSLVTSQTTPTTERPKFTPPGVQPPTAPNMESAAEAARRTGDGLSHIEPGEEVTIRAKEQEKTGNLPSALPAVEWQLDFSTGTLGLWSSNHFVIYYRDGRVPQPGIILLGRVMGDVLIFDQPGPVTVRIERIK